MRRTAWDRVVYVARYARQPFDQVFPLTTRQVRNVIEAIGRLVEKENTPRK